ncbi:hypothetical protein CHLRE_14g614000v5 [Chlamydomonas reinhardtii]|uniref:Transmembrane protein n=1 Tax=Chlamydomonas reinhardtii TaxID=3055 RepID=A8JAP2_CHLRE|nr:uncharacterized protein CHLRE_14g614000v5 [Chlamydomonas reinhardtii]PNW72977.1 hypothetical protein CHLRE_14g614000v5 [Chlamydomonas reinhardtii]|eukprot:XP_001698993.1 predicted protein [Chlamydomonas reinhardtii]
MHSSLLSRRVCPSSIPSRQSTLSVPALKATSARRWSVRARAEPEEKPDGSFESLFSKELARRGLNSMDEPGKPGESAGSTGAPSTSASSTTPGSSTSNTGGPAAGPAQGTNPFASSSTTTTRTRARAPPPPMAGAGAGAGAAGGDDQRQRSMDMVTEGLEGLPGRAKLLLQLGGSVFLGFLPFMLAFSLLFTGVFFVFGDNFLHGGRPAVSPPRYIDPEALLSEPTVDPYVPYNSNPYTAPELK